MSDRDDDVHDDGVDVLWASRTPVPGTWTVIDEAVFLDGIGDGLPKGWELHWSPGPGGGRGRVGWFESRDCMLAAVQVMDDARPGQVTVDDLLAGHGFAKVVGPPGKPRGWERPLSSGRVARVVPHGEIDVSVRRGEGEARLVLSLFPGGLARPWPREPEGKVSILALGAALVAFECTLDPFYMGP